MSGDVKPDFHQKLAYVIMDLNPKLKLLLGPLEGAVSSTCMPQECFSGASSLPELTHWISIVCC